MIQFIINNFTDFLAALTSVVTGASALSAMTPTQKDDKFLGKAKRVLDIFALNVANAKTAAA